VDVFVYVKKFCVSFDLMSSSLC